MIKITGLKEFQNKLDALAKNVEKLGKERRVPIIDALTPAFLVKHTSAHSVDEFFDNSGFKIETAEDFEAIPDEEWDAYIRKISNFADWQSMLSKAAEEWAIKKLAI